MTCARQQTTFRLLDAWVGWSQSSVEKLTGLQDELGLTLDTLTHYLTLADLSPAIPPARLARGCGSCEWYLATPCEPESRLLFRNPCDRNWQSVWDCERPPAPVQCVNAIGSRCDYVALSDSSAEKLWLLRDRGRQLITGIDIAAPGPVTDTPWNTWLVVDSSQGNLRTFDPAGGEQAVDFPRLVGTVDRLAFDQTCRLWVVFVANGELRIGHAARGDSEWTDSNSDALLDAFPDTGLVAVTENGFCLRPRDRLTGEGDGCYTWYGRRASRDDIEGKPQALYETRGQLLTAALDSGIPRCRWHRVRIDAHAPDETAVSVSVSAHEDPDPPPQGKETDPAWQSFQAGVPHPGDWQTPAAGSHDFLIDQPPGRYLFVRLRLTGNGLSTPTVHRLRLDFPRQTSIDSLPIVYRDNPDAEAFTERFLALFDAATEDIDSSIERLPALLDSDGVAPEVLPWLGTFLDVAMDPSWSVERRRRVLAAIPDLYRRRGTVTGLERSVRLLFDTTPVIEETFLERMWEALGTARLGGVRVFSPARARFRIGRSPVARAPIASYGNPDTDPLTVQAHRFRVFVPGFDEAATQSRVEALIASQKPAHTVASVNGSRRGFVLGPGSRVGVDTAITPLPPPVLNKPGMRLNRASILWRGSGCHGPAIKAGQTSVIGVNTVME